MTPCPTQLWVFRARPIRAVDGDTVDVEVDGGFGNRRVERLRLLGVDTPERGQPGYREATEHVACWLGSDSDWPLLIETEKSDAFGRYLALVWRASDGQCLNDDLIESGHAVPYRR
jgi:micrococcal nuclease